MPVHLRTCDGVSGNKKDTIPCKRSNMIAQGRQWVRIRHIHDILLNQTPLPSKLDRIIKAVTA